jgi:hypothetical protein
MKTRSALLTFAGFGLVATMGITACGAEGSAASGTGSGDPKEQIVSAFGDLGKLQGLGLEMKLESSRADLEKINAAQPEDERLVKADVDLAVAALDGKLLSSFSAAPGKTLADGPSSYQMSVQLKEASLIDMVGVDDVFYLRADAPWLAQQFELDVAELRTFVADMDPVITKPANALLDSKWVSIDLAQAEQALQDSDLSELTASDPARAYALLASLQQAFEADAKVTEIDGGYRVTAPAQQIVAAVKDDVLALAGESGADSIEPEIDSIPDRDITFDLFLDGGKLTGVNLDLVQFLDEPVEGAELALDVQLDRQSNTVQAPADATAVDTKEILRLLGW